MKSTREMVDELRGTKCICGKPKKSKRTFCFACYHSLPASLQKDLYNRIGEGYEQAYDASVAYLGPAK